MKCLGIHSFFWTGSPTQEGLAMVIEKSAERRSRGIKFAFLHLILFVPASRLTRKSQALGIQIDMTIRRPLNKDLSSTDPDLMNARKAMLADAIRAQRNVGSGHIKLHMYNFNMQVEKANTAFAISSADDRLEYFHIRESNGGFLGDGTIA